MLVQLLFVLVSSRISYFWARRALKLVILLLTTSIERNYSNFTWNCALIVILSVIICKSVHMSAKLCMLVCN